VSGGTRSETMAAEAKARRAGMAKRRLARVFPAALLR
jgi:hypothetical protein